MKTALIILTILLATSGTPAAEQTAPPDLHTAWDALLQKHVSNGNVDYKAFQRNVAQLDAYLATLGTTDPSSLSRNGRLAYWINAYNAFTVKLILNHYPVKSIRKLERPWKQKFWMAAGKMHSLDQIEHAILRRKFKEPRIHFAIVCASVSCPDLHNRAFTEKEVEKQLDLLTRHFLTSGKHLRTEEKKRLFRGKEKILHLSQIFNWFRDDFTNGGKRTVVDFVSQYVDKPTRDLLLSGGQRVTVRYLDYDWGLNGR